MLRFVALILLAILLYLGVKLWAGDWGIRGVWRLEQQVAEQKQKNEQLRRSNEKLSADLEDLKNGKEAIEERARSELGLVKPGEVFYHVVEPAPGAKKDENGGH